MTARLPRSRHNGKPPHEIDPFQQRARSAAGIPQPRPPTTHKPHLVEGIMPVVCQFCFCTNTRPLSQKHLTCTFCGKHGKGIPMP